MMKQAFHKRFALLLISVLLIAMGPAPSVADREGMVGQKAPDFVLKDLTGKSIPLSSYRGKIVLLNFWATWCPPCKSEMPFFQKLYREENARGIEVIAVSTDKSAKDVMEYVSKNRFDFTILMDEKAATSKLYKVISMPSTFLIDRNGIIVEKLMGEHEWSSPEIRKKLEKLL